MQNVSECSKMYAECMQIHEFACSYICLHAGPWACMQLHKLACSYIGLHAVTKAYMQLDTLACSYISFHAHAVLWAYMKFHELIWIFISLQFHELVCNFYLCLSSSQEFRSACYIDSLLMTPSHLYGTVTEARGLVSIRFPYKLSASCLLRGRSWSHAL